MITTEDLQAITERLKKPEIDQVILFGSYANGTANKDSDLDLVVVTRHDIIPSTFRERMDIYIDINSYILDYCKKFQIDLIIHTRKTFKKFIDKNSSFSRMIVKDGITLYERKNS